MPTQFIDKFPKYLKKSMDVFYDPVPPICLVISLEEQVEVLHILSHIAHVIRMKTILAFEQAEIISQYAPHPQMLLPPELSSREFHFFTPSRHLEK
jgi:hypothetical protein